MFCPHPSCATRPAQVMPTEHDSACRRQLQDAIITGTHHIPVPAQTCSSARSDSLPELATPASLRGDGAHDADDSEFLDPVNRTRAPAPLRANVDRCETAADLPDLLV